MLLDLVGSPRGIHFGIAPLLSVISSWRSVLTNEQRVIRPSAYPRTLFSGSQMRNPCFMNALVPTPVVVES